MNLCKFAEGVLGIYGISKKTKMAQAQKVKDFFIKLGCKDSPSISAVKKWFLGVNKPSTSSYFETLTVSSDAAKNLLVNIRLAGGHDFTKYQQEFSRIIQETNDLDCVIDTQTDNENEFYSSIVKQFLRFFGLEVQYSDDEVSLIYENMQASDRAAQSENNDILTEEIVSEKNIIDSTEALLSSDFGSVNPATNNIKAEDGVRALTIPTEYNKCLYCDYFELMAKDGDYLESPKKGSCQFSHFVLPAKSACDEYIPNFNRINRDLVKNLKNKLPN